VLSIPLGPLLLPTVLDTYLECSRRFQCPKPMFYKLAPTRPHLGYTVTMRKVLPFLLLLGASLAHPSQADAKKEAAQVAELKRLRAALFAAQTRQAKQTQEEKNKQLVLTFYQRFFGDKDITAADQYLAPSYIQHNPLAATGRDAVKKFFTPFFANPAIPKTKIDVRRVAADGDLVWLHIRSKTTGAERAVVDIFRIKDGKIVEHWDVIQAVPEKSLNENTMF
jgi:predicted SnoaL-like aldol condensation-catalyzing enzyme